MHAFSSYFLHWIDHYGYAGLFVVMTLANIGAPVGSELVLPAAGALVATGHLSNVWFALAFAVGGELAGQSIGYTVGRYGGRPFVDKFGPLVRFHHAELERVEGFFKRYGSFAIFICRFIPVIRGIVAVPAGIAEMPLVPFYTWTFLGSLIFCSAFIFLGRALGAHSDEVGATFHRYLAIIVPVVVLAIGTFFFVRWRVSKGKP